MNGNRALAEPDVILVGAGIMSATLGTFLKELAPSLTIAMYERLDGPALESSDAWNNAGTGHAANCELNYTPERSDGSIDISKALEVNTEFDLSRQLWAYLVKKGAIADPRSFIHPVPHMSFVHGPEYSCTVANRCREVCSTCSTRYLVRSKLSRATDSIGPMLASRSDLNRSSSEPCLRNLVEKPA
jgi:L-2-hydroxyglutarate oxidase LhgO